MKKNVFENTVQAKDFIVNPSFDELRKLAKDREVTTEFGSASYTSKIRNRSAKYTEILYNDATQEQETMVTKAQEYLKTKTLVRLDRQMCKNPNFSLHCRYYVPVEHAQIPFAWGQTLFDCPDPEGKPDIVTVMIPDWPERKMLVDPKAQTSYLLGTDYIGEVKKAHLRMAMYIAKKRGMLGLHAGSKEMRFLQDGKMVDKGVILFGLSGTGKTTLTCHHHGLCGQEGITIRQDDVIMMDDHMHCTGTEDNFYIKTEGLEPVGQQLLYSAAASSKAVLENIWVGESGEVDFNNDEYTSNGRAVVYRSDMRDFDEHIDLKKADIVVFITRRNDVVPPVIRLTPEQGAAFFMLGESIETSAGDPTKAGQSLRCVGTNPFIIGPCHEEGNRFLNILRKNPDTQVFLMNTGYIGGNNGQKITIKDSTEIIKSIAFGKIKWEKDDLWGYEVATQVDGIDVGRLDPRKYYTKDEYTRLNNVLKKERKEWLEKFEGLDPVIIQSLNLELSTVNA
jgi:phosphoenolpyruvate carboxykinase (ATP)